MTVAELAGRWFVVSIEGLGTGKQDCHSAVRDPSSQAHRDRADGLSERRRRHGLDDKASRWKRTGPRGAAGFRIWKVIGSWHRNRGLIRSDQKSHRRLSSPAVFSKSRQAVNHRTRNVRYNRIVPL